MISQTIRRHALLLALFAVCATAVVAITHYFTAPVIASQQRNMLMRTLHELLPPSRHDNDMFHDCTLQRSRQFLGDDRQHPIYRARFKGKPVAAAIHTVAPNGYGGAIELLVVINADGSVAGVRTLTHQETPGLGDGIEHTKSNWIRIFEGKTIDANDDPRWQVKKDGGIFDQFTGATITPRAVVAAVKNTLLFFKYHQQQLFNAPADCNAVEEEN